jgi:hypothetical protein
MAISRVPGYSLLANLDRQGTDIGITSSGLYVTYWDVVNYRFGINNSAPQQALDVTGNILTSNGHIYTNANISFDLGANNNWWRTAYAQTVQAINLSGTLLTNAQPNITSVGTIANLVTSGNTYLVGSATVNGNLNVTNILTVGNISTSGITGNITGNLTGFVLQGNQPFITNLANITVSNITIQSGVLNVAGNISTTNVNASSIYQNGNQILDSATNIQVTGDVVGYGTFSNVQVALPNSGVAPGTYQAPLIAVDNKGRITFASNASISQLGNLFFSNTTISSDYNLTLLTNTNGNIVLNSSGTGIVQITGSDAVQIPYGDDSLRPTSPALGYFRYNTDRSSIEYWDGSNWLQPGVTYITSDVINPDGVSNVYALSSNATSAGLIVSINGTLQQPDYSYSVINNNQIQFTEVPLTSDTIEVRHVSAGVVTSVQALRYGPKTAVVLDAENVNIVGNIILNGSINNKANTLIPNVATTTIDSYSTTAWRTVKYVIQAVRASDVQSYETLVTHNGATVVATTYGVLTIGNSLGNISATLVSGNVEVQYTPVSANTYLTVSRDFYPL